MSENSFYSTLYSAIENGDKIPSSKICVFQNDNTTSAELNGAGNVKIVCDIPYSSKGDKAPNYMELVLNTDVDSNNVLGVISNLIKSPDFICNPSDAGINIETDTNPVKIADGKITAKKVPWINMQQLMSSDHDNQWKYWNLNYNRNYDNDSVRKVSAKIMSQLNDVIEYVINEDLKKPDANFRELIKNIFSQKNGNKTEIFSYAHDTLLLPTLIDLIYMKRGNDAKDSHSLEHVGYVMKNSEMLFRDIPDTNVDAKAKENVATNEAKESFRRFRRRGLKRESYAPRQYPERIVERIGDDEFENKILANDYDNVRKWYAKGTYAPPASIGNYVISTDADLLTKDLKEKNTHTLKDGTLFVNGQLQQIGAYNFPFCTKEKESKWEPKSSIKITNNNAFPEDYQTITKNVGFKFTHTQDPYEFKDTREANNYAVVTYGMKELPKVKYGSRALQPYEYKYKKEVSLPVCWTLDAMTADKSLKLKGDAKQYVDRKVTRYPERDVEPIILEGGINEGVPDKK